MESCVREAARRLVGGCHAFNWTLLPNQLNWKRSHFWCTFTITSSLLCVKKSHLNSFISPNKLIWQNILTFAELELDQRNSVFQPSFGLKNEPRPHFAGRIHNVTVNVGREAVLECPVNHLGHYKVCLRQVHWSRSSLLSLFPGWLVKSQRPNHISSTSQSDYTQ